jgi:N utilization substance protein A
VVLDDDEGRIEVVVPDEQLSLAIGRRGQNVRLASMLTGWDIDIMTEEEESRRRQEEMRARSELFIEALDVDDVIAHLLVAEGFNSLEQVAFVPLEEVSQIEGFDDEVANELRARARSYLEELDRRNDERRRELGVSDELAAIAGLTPKILVALGENGIKTLDDLGDLASDELIETLGDLAPGQEEVDTIIMAERAHWFEDEESPAAAEGEETPAAAEGEETPISAEDEKQAAETDPEGSGQADKAGEA